jgi:TPR repeat protein
MCVSESQQGIGRAISNMGFIYQLGIGVEKDLNVAVTFDVAPLNSSIVK